MSEKKDAVKYTLAIIARNSAENLDKLLTNFGEYPDEIVVVNTAAMPAEDGYGETNAVALKHGAKVFDFPWCQDFSAARNFSFKQASHPWVLWLDTDDIIENPEEVDRNARFAMDTGSINCLLMEYLYEFDQHGNCTLVLDRERFVLRGQFEWRAPVHEVLCATTKLEATRLPPDIGRVIHSRKQEDVEDRNKSLRRNLRILREQYEKPKKDPGLRMLFYWANTLLGLGDYSGAEEKYKEYLDRSLKENSKNPGEQYVAMWSCSEALRQQRKFDEAFEMAGRGILLKPLCPSAYMHASQALMGINDLDRAVVYANLTKQYAPNIKDEMVAAPKAISGVPDLMIAQAYCLKGDWERALGHLELCKTFYSEAQEWKNIDEWAQQMRDHVADKEAFSRIVDKMMAEKKFKAIHSLALNAPGNLSDTREVASLLPKKRPENRRSIAFFCPETLPGFNWGPWSIKAGIGGSEEAVINAAKEFSRAGWHVEVYCPTGKSRKDSPLIAEGVEWWPLHCWTGKHDNEIDVLVWWRVPMGPQIVDHRAKVNISWMHDIYVPQTWTKGAIDEYDGVILLSKFHRELHTVVPDDKAILSENALDPDLLVPLDNLTNISAKMIWGSDPSRGLQYLLPQWPKIKAAVPEAELHIYYGWSPHYMNTIDVNKGYRDIYEFIEKNKKQPGITWHGKVGQDVLAKAYASSGVWGYPCEFPEIHCITALKAQAHGCIPVTVDGYALKETVQYGHKLPGPMNEPTGAIDKWTETVIDVMKNPWTREKRLEMATWARTHTWEAVVRGWLDHFERLLESKQKRGSASLTLTPAS